MISRSLSSSDKVETVSIRFNKPLSFIKLSPFR
nr:MAG TPA: hypothetical protein [Caudoviricetes sp.]